MALVLPNNMAEHSEAGSNSYNGPGSTGYPFDGTIEAQVNWLRAALAPESPLWLQERALWVLQREFRDGFCVSRICHIAEAYGRESYSRDVYKCFERVHHDLVGFDRCLKLRAVLPCEDYRAVCLRESLERNSLRHATGIICSCRTPSEIQGLKERYHSILGVQFEVDIRRFTDGYHRELLLAHMAIQTPAARHGDIDVEMFDRDRVERISGSLHQALEITYDSPQKDIVNKFVGLGEEYLSDVKRSYLERYGRSLEMDLMHERHGLFERAILTMMKCSVNRPKYFAEVLHKAMRDPNGRAMRDTSQIDRDTIVSVITTMAQRDMNMMKAEYLLEYGSTVEGDIALAFSDRQDCMEVLSVLLNSDASN